mmetsp:Transcript_7370/g.12651  ORF Transcript_7370/g.12651 Transcript_7370/m.12651 type:complete len:238 (+) Transcript_7370:524-1237(+)
MAAVPTQASATKGRPVWLTSWVTGGALVISSTVRVASWATAASIRPQGDQATPWTQPLQCASWIRVPILAIPVSPSIEDTATECTRIVFAVVPEASSRLSGCHEMLRTIDDTPSRTDLVTHQFDPASGQAMTMAPPALPTASLSSFGLHLMHVAPFPSLHGIRVETQRSSSKCHTYASLSSEHVAMRLVSRAQSIPETLRSCSAKTYASLQSPSVRRICTSLFRGLKAINVRSLFQA